ncbi:unnamed protein product [Toxocara canis]|uniref:7TM_GPCR_Srx domain-containing protein n=1 Tax=Toxocara canis TaxID=6265 RepID=A0A183UK24_TOXCA|nr:unnamed protein product [Toxocara canis]
MNDMSESAVKFENYLAGILVILVASPGVILNSSSAVMLAHIKTLKGSFAALCITNCCVNLTILLIFIGWAAPSLFLGRNPTGGLLNRIISQVAFALWLGSVNCQTLLASNRFIAIFFPLKYDKIYSKNNVAIYLALFVSITIIAPSIGFQDGCNLFFDAQSFVWLFNPAPCGSTMFFWMGFIYEIVVFVVVIILDSAIFMKLRLINKHHARMSVENQKKLVQDKRFFWQAFLTNVNFMFVLLNFNVSRMFVQTRFGGFVVVTIVWELGHTLDGNILPTMKKLTTQLTDE